MKPASFAYTDPASLPEALDALAEYGDEGKILAGGQSLVPLLNMRLAQPQVLIDLNRVPDLSYIRAEAREGMKGIALGSMTRQAGIEASIEIRSKLPLLAEGIGWVGHPQIRNRGTIGGSIAHADPAAELPLTFLVLEGIALAQSARGARAIPAADFFLYTFTPALEPDEILTEVWLPAHPPRTGYAFMEVARRHGDFALVGVAVLLSLGDHGTVVDARVALAGAAPVPIRVHAAEDLLCGERAGLALFREAGKVAARDSSPTGDIHADAEYRREVAGTLTFRALTRAFERTPEDDE